MARSAAMQTADERMEQLHLSEWAIAALEREVLSVLEDDAVYGDPEPEEQPTETHHRAPRRHWRLTTAAIDARILLVPVILMFAVIGLIAAVGSTYVVAFVAFAALVVGVVLVAQLIITMTREVEHVSPETAALLEEEGVGDPDRLFGELLAARRSA
jgi:hypothetical protein